MSTRKYSHVIWDWNGTILNDVEWCIKVVNKMLSKRKLKTVSSVNEYHKAFCFPIIQYYKNVGFAFDAEPFEDLAEEFISLYYSAEKGELNLFPNAVNVLSKIREKGISQIVLSASELNFLLSQVNEFETTEYFDQVLGLSDIYAKSKIEAGTNYIHGNEVKRALLVGDTEHDFETAKKLGADCVLISCGHQSREKLLEFGAPVLDDISSVLKFL